MRQAGVLAAAGIVALETMRGRLAEDHDNARALAEGLASLPGLTLDTPPVLTNIVYVKVAGSRWRNRAVVEELKRQDVLCNAVGDRRIRLVTHHDVGRDGIQAALAAMGRALDIVPV